MMATSVVKPDPKLDLVLERVVDVPPHMVWAAWTEPAHIVKWFAPAPWKTVDCEIDLRPGGIFRATMRSPDGKDFPVPGCILDVVKNERLIWTDALLPGFRPSEKPFFTAVITMEPHGKGTRYVARAMHGDEATRKRHEEMGFADGWAKCLDQLVEHMKSL
jgi:uncharacterized protein YndB with AHSA1/START domain